VNRPGARKDGPLFFYPLLQTFVLVRRMMDLFDVEASEKAESQKCQVGRPCHLARDREIGHPEILEFPIPSVMNRY
jgi:hypothetical protein